MFESFYGLNANPFRLSPDERFLYVHTSYVKARAYLKYALERAEGFVMVTGPPGTGKTLLIQDILSELNPAKTLVAHLVSNQLHAEDLLRMVALVFGFHAETYDKGTLLNLIQRYVAEQHEAGRRAILIIDDAQNLPVKSLEELRLLSNLQTTDQSLLQIFLIGQEELRGIILGPGMEQFSQRLIATCRIEAMNSYQTQEYIEHRLDIAGWKHDPLLDPAIFPLIHHFSQGIPRQINHLAGRMLLFGALEGKHSLLEDDVWTVLEELHEEHLLPTLDDQTLESVKATYKRPSMSAPPAPAKSAVNHKLNPAATTGDESPKTTARIKEEENLLAGLGQEPITPAGLFDESSTETAHEAVNTSHDAAAPMLAQNGHPQDTASTQTKFEASADTSASTVETSSSHQLGTGAQSPSASTPDETVLPQQKLSHLRKGNSVLHWMTYMISAVVILLALVLPKPGDLPLVWQAIMQQGQSLLWPHHAGRETAQMPPRDMTAGNPARHTPGRDDSPIITPQTDRLEAEITETTLLDIAPPPQLAPNPQTVEYMEKLPWRRSLTPDPQTVEAAAKPPLPAPDPQTVEAAAKPPLPTPDTHTVDATVKPPLPATAHQDMEPTMSQNLSIQTAEDRSTQQQQAMDDPAPDLSGLEETHQILFGFDSSKINPEHIPVLDGIISSLRQHAQRSIQITGFTDSSGDPIYNKLLAERRADAIANYLLNHGIAQERIHTVGQGPLPEEPGMEIESLQDRLNKRRVELRIILPVSTKKSRQGRVPPDSDMPADVER